MRRRLVAVLIAAGVALSAVGCGQGEGIGQAASEALAPQVAAVRTAAETGSRNDALAKLAALRQTVAQLRNSGELSEEGAAKVRAAAVEVEGQLGLLPAPAPAGGSSGPATGAGVRDENQRKAEDEARKRAEEAVKKAEEDAKKRADDAKKRAEENKKDD